MVASQLHLEMVGVYVEDEDLVRLAQLPFAREVGFQGGTPRSIDAETMRKQLRAHAALSRRDMESRARQHKVPASFVLRRGAVTTEILSVCANADCLVIGRSTSARSAGRLGATAGALARSARRPVWLVQPRRTPIDTVLLVLTAADDIRATIDACLGVTDPKARLVIAVTAGDSAESDAAVHERIEAALAEAKRSAEYVRLPQLDARTLSAQAARLGDPIVVLSLPAEQDAAAKITAIAAALKYDVVVVPALDGEA